MFLPLLSWNGVSVKGDFTVASTGTSRLGSFLRFKKSLTFVEMDLYTQLFWVFTILFVSLSGYLLCCTKKTNVFYLQIASGLGIFATSKIGRKFLGLE
jgi:hypothetical protein